MQSFYRRLPFALAALTTALFAAQAHAGCGALDPTTVLPQLPAPTMQQDRWLPEPAYGAARMMHVGYLLPVSDREYSNLPIVGLWKFTMTARGNTGGGPPDGTPIDAGYQTWHADRTEIMNSGRPADTSNFCMGVWKPTAHGSYKLNHFALAWSGVVAGAKNMFVGPANIREEVTLESGESRFDGTFSIDQYDATGTTVLQHVVGTVTATRVTAD